MLLRAVTVCLKPQMDRAGNRGIGLMTTTIQKHQISNHQTLNLIFKKYLVTKLFRYPVTETTLNHSLSNILLSTLTMK
jgi:hypothetical protein